MKRLALILDLDGRPVERSGLELMLGAAADGERRASDVWVDGPIGLGVVRTGAAEAGRFGVAAVATDPAGRRIVLDGRIDNADELRRTLAHRDVVPASGSGEELILSAYERWGAGSPAEILGDFAFVLWDPARMRLLAARDVLGLKPLVYCHVGRTLYVASEIRQLLAIPEVPRTPNEGMVGEYLAESITDTGETLYAAIRRLPPAHILTVRSGEAAVVRYWDADLAARASSGSEAEHAEHLLELLTAAVRCRVRERTIVGAQLSGGVDSTAVVGLARHLRRSPTGPQFQLECFATTYEGHPEADERDAIEAAAAFFGLRPHLLPAGRPGRRDFAAWSARDLDLPPYPGDLSSDPMMAAARARGCSVLLTGNGGDEWFWGFEGTWARLAGRLRAASTASARLGVGRQLVAAVTASVLPTGLVRRLRAVRRSRIPLSWIPRDFRRRIALDDRLALCWNGRRNPRSPRETTAMALDHGALVHGREVAERYAAGFGIEERHPFHDRRVFEFALALPPEHLLRDGTHKLVLREALTGLVPDRSRLRQDKAEFSHLVAEALLTPSISGALRSLAIADRGWVSAEHVHAMLLETRRLYEAGSPDYRRLIWPLWMVFGVETWYREAFPSS